MHATIHHYPCLLLAKQHQMKTTMLPLATMRIT